MPLNYAQYNTYSALNQACFLVADDVMDSSVTRRGKPCWYKVPEVGLGKWSVCVCVGMEWLCFIENVLRF